MALRLCTEENVNCTCNSQQMQGRSFSLAASLVCPLTGKQKTKKYFPPLLFQGLSNTFCVHVMKIMGDLCDVTENREGNANAQKPVEPVQGAMCIRLIRTHARAHHPELGRCCSSVYFFFHPITKRQ